MLARILLQKNATVSQAIQMARSQSMKEDFLSVCLLATVAHLVEHVLGKDGVMGSIPIGGSIFVFVRWRDG